MATDRVKKLRSMIANVEETLSYFQPLQHKGELYGDRKYTPESLEMALRILLNEFSDLIETKFFESLPIGERNEITKLLASLVVSTHRREYNQAANHADELKVLIRDYRAKMLLEPEALSAALEKWQESSSQIDSLMKNLDVQSQQIRKLFAESQNRDEGLQQIEEAHKAKLNEYSEQQREALSEINNLKEEAKAALHYTVPAGISADFTKRYTSNKKWWKAGLNFLWLLMAGVSIGGALWAIYWLLPKMGIELEDYIAKLTIMIPAIGVAWFCATRYARYSNITEDYGFKAILARSMVAFLNQFQDKERAIYLTTVLTQLFQDPLRKRHDTKHPAESILRSITRSKQDSEGD